MALISLGESKWRMIRRVLRKKRFAFVDARNGTRHDRLQFEWLVANGFAVLAGDGQYELTDKGRAAADLGLYEV